MCVCVCVFFQLHDQDVNKSNSKQNKTKTETAGYGTLLTGWSRKSNWDFGAQVFIMDRFMARRLRTDANWHLNSRAGHTRNEEINYI